jgi:uncharacterized protein YbdZ (MbtH family)
MNDLFLRIRLEALERNVRQVKALVAVVRRNNRSVRDLHKLLEPPGAPVTVSLRRVQMAVRSIANLFEYPDVVDMLGAYGVPDPLKSAQEGLKALDTNLAKAQKLTEQLLVNVKETDILLNREQVKRLFGVGTADKLLTGTLRLRKELRERDGDGAAEASPEAWARYRELVGDQDQFSLFQEYVDIAAGLSLRGTGMDEHFCAMADWLSDHWTSVVSLPHWFAIPARQDPTAKESIIRLEFPEWTIWALPLVAHEFGRILVDEYPEFRELTEDLAGQIASEPQPDLNEDAVERERQAQAARIRTYLADVFATYVMGPAYACACLLLKLDPTEVGQPMRDRGWDLMRAQVVLATLDKINPGLQSNLTGIIATLRDSWKAALTQLGSAQSDDREMTLIEPAVNRAVAALELIEEQNETPIGFDDDAWAEAGRQAETYFGDLVPGAEPPPVTDPATSTEQPTFKLDAVTLPEVLNAAWSQRLMYPDPKMADAIASRVRERIWPYLKPPSVGRKRPPSDIRP